MNTQTNQANAAFSTLPATMQAIAIEAYGEPDVMQMRELPVPRPGPNQLLIRVHAASVNPVDWKMREGQLRWIVPLRFPAILGRDVSGTVAALGSGAAEAGWNVGDEVCAFLDQRQGGGYARYAVAGCQVVARKPAMLTHEEAAAIPLAAITAWQSLLDLGKLQSGDRVLVNGASGGVGTFAIQIARAQGARVTGVCSSSNLELVRELGADDVIDYTQQDLTKQDRRYDIVFDAVAKSSYRACRNILTADGTYVSTLPSPQTIMFAALTKLTSRGCRLIVAKPNGQQLRQLMQMAEDGKLRSIIDQVIPLEHAAEAHRISQQGRVRGKLVLAV